MLPKKKYVIIIIAFVSVMGILLILYFIQNNSPADILKRKIHLSLPATSEVIHFNNNIIFGDLNAKIQINEQDVESIKKDLLEYFGQEYIIENIDNIPHNENYVSWWDMDKNNIESCYKKVTGIKHNSTIIWVFIVKQDDGMYYLYISYL